VTAEGDLVVYPAEAIYVFHIFERFVAGDSLGKISVSLARMDVLSPTGKKIWSKETISKMLNSEKYLGDVVLGKT
jgi:Recombinase.